MSLGLFTSLQIKEAATYGEVASFASGTKYHLAVRPNVNLVETVTRISTEHTRQTGAQQAEEDAVGLRSVTGSFEGVWPFSGFLAFILKHLLGIVTTTGTDPYTHVIVYGDKIFAGFSAAVRRGEFLHCYHGLQMNGFGYTVAAGAPVTWKADVVGSQMDVQALAAPTALVFPVSGDPYLLGQRTTLTFAAGALIFTEISFDFKPTLEVSEEKSYKCGSDLRSLLVRSGMEITCTLKRRHLVDGTGNASKMYNNLLSGASAAIQVSAVHNTIPASFSMVQDWSAAKVTDQQSNVRDMGVIPEEITLKLFNFNTVATNKITIIDKNSAPITATGAYDGEAA